MDSIIVLFICTLGVFFCINKISENHGEQLIPVSEVVRHGAGYFEPSTGKFVWKDESESHKILTGKAEQ